MSRFTLILCLTTIFLNYFCEINGARILGVFPVPALSHYSLGSKLMKKLALRGHEVTMISTYGLKTPMKNYKDVILKELNKEMEKHTKKIIIEANSKSIFESISHLFEMTYKMTERTLQHPNTIKLLHSPEKFDLVIMDGFLNEAHVVFAHRFNAPLIVLSTAEANFLIENYVKYPAPLSYCPLGLLENFGKMSFFGRLQNTIFKTFLGVILNCFHYPNQNALVQKYFPGAPDITNIINERFSLLLLNSHPSISPTLPTVPNMIEIGGFHIDEPKKLPKDLKKYCDDAKEGFILFSMGSDLKSANLPEDKRNILLSVFKNLPYKILWKFDDKKLPGKPENVKIAKRLPQNDILAHPNLKLFITHGGLSSTIDAVYHTVPLVGIPKFSDQKINMQRAKSLGIAEKVDFVDLNYNNLWNAIQEVLNNKMYLENVRNRSILLRDQPIKPIDSAIFWIEYTIYHKTNNHLKTNAIHLKWWELWNLDVIAFLGTVAFVIVYSLYWMAKRLYQTCFKRNTCKRQVINKKKCVNKSKNKLS